VDESQEAKLRLEDISSTPFQKEIGEAKDPRELRELAQKESERYYEDYERRINKAKADREEEIVRILQQDRLERQKYAKYLFNLICFWLLGIFTIIIFSGLNASTIRLNYQDLPVVRRVEGVPKFELSDGVLLALIGGTTINVLGLFVIVANYLFNSPKDPREPK
jgi:hypothetical protein